MTTNKSANAARQRRYRERTKAPNSGALVIPSMVLTDSEAIRIMRDEHETGQSYRLIVERALRALCS